MKKAKMLSLTTRQLPSEEPTIRDLTSGSREQVPPAKKTLRFSAHVCEPKRKRTRILKLNKTKGSCFGTLLSGQALLVPGQSQK